MYKLKGKPQRQGQLKYNLKNTVIGVGVINHQVVLSLLVSYMYIHSHSIIKIWAIITQHL